MMNRIEAIESWISKTVEKDLEDDIPNDDIVASIVIGVFGVLIGAYYVAHQTRSTGFFTEAFGTLEMFLFYGFLIYWIVTSALILLGHKNLSRDLDFGGLFFATASIAWLFVVFPFDFAHFADVLPDSLRFLVQWISNDIARVLMVPAFIVHLGFAVVSALLRVSVYRARAGKTRLHGLSRVE